MRDSGARVAAASPDAGVSAPTTFLPVRVIDSSPARVPAGAGFEVEFPNGRVVRVPPSFDDATLERLLAIVAGETG